MASQKIIVFANGKARQIAPETTVRELIESFPVNPGTVLVEINGNALFREEWTRRSLEHGDRLEVVRMVAGG